MPIACRTIRLFVCSTFSDLKAERDALQREVFPRLKQLCLSKGLRFQAIDLRWGVSEGAGRHNSAVTPLIINTDPGSSGKGTGYKAHVQTFHFC